MADLKPQRPLAKDSTTAGAQLSPDDLKRVRNVLNVSRILTSKGKLDLRSWTTFDAFKDALRTAVDLPTARAQRRAIKDLAKKCDDLTAQYDRRMHSKRPVSEAPEVTAEKKRWVEALRLDLMKLHDCVRDDSRVRALLFLHFLTHDAIAEIEALRTQVDARLEKIKREAQLVAAQAGSKRMRGEQLLQEMRREARELGTALLKREIAFSLGVEILDMITRLDPESEVAAATRRILGKATAST
jgi:hypothetical protein